MPTTCCRPPRSSSTWTCTPPTATPTRCSTSRRSRRWARRGRTRRSSASWPRAWASTDACFADSDEAMARGAFEPERVDFDALREQGWVKLPLARGAVRRRRLPHAQRQGAWSTRRAWACPTTCPTTKARSRRRSWPQRYPLAMISPPARNFLNSSFVNVQEPARHRGRAAAGDPRRRRRRARHRRRRRWCASSTTAASYLCKAAVSDARAARRRQRPGRVVAQARRWPAPTSTSSRTSGSPTSAARRRSTTAWSRSSGAA